MRAVAFQSTGFRSTTNFLFFLLLFFLFFFSLTPQVRVRTKSIHDSKQWVWESSVGASSYTITEDDGEDSEDGLLERGTAIELQLREDMQEYADADRVAELVKTYSEFISFPIMVWQGEPGRRKEKNASVD